MSYRSFFYSPGHDNYTICSYPDDCCEKSYDKQFFHLSFHIHFTFIRGALPLPSSPQHVGTPSLHSATKFHDMFHITISYAYTVF